MISAREQIVSTSHIVVTFNFRFGAHNGLKSDIAACPKRAMSDQSINGAELRLAKKAVSHLRFAQK